MIRRKYGTGTGVGIGSGLAEVELELCVVAARAKFKPTSSLAGGHSLTLAHSREKGWSVLAIRFGELRALLRACDAKNGFHLDTHTHTAGSFANAQCKPAIAPVPSCSFLSRVIFSPLHFNMTNRGLTKW